MGIRTPTTSRTAACTARSCGSAARRSGSPRSSRRSDPSRSSGSGTHRTGAPPWSGRSRLSEQPAAGRGRLAWRSSDHLRCSGHRRAEDVADAQTRVAQPAAGDQLAHDQVHPPTLAANQPAQVVAGQLSVLAHGGEHVAGDPRLDVSRAHGAEYRTTTTTLSDYRTPSCRDLRATSAPGYPGISE